MFKYLRSLIGKMQSWLTALSTTLSTTLSYIRRGITNVVVSIITLVLVIVIGAVVLGQLTSVVDTFGLTGTANTTVTNLFNQVWNAFNLFIIIPILVVAGVVIVILRGFGGGGRK